LKAATNQPKQVPTWAAKEPNNTSDEEFFSGGDSRPLERTDRTGGDNQGNEHYDELESENGDNVESDDNGVTTKSDRVQAQQDDVNDDDVTGSFHHQNNKVYVHHSNVVTTITDPASTPSTVSFSQSSDNSSVSRFSNPSSTMNMEFVIACKKARWQSIRAFVKTHLFKRVKFVTKESELSWTFPHFAVPILDHLRVNGSVAREKAWEEYQSYAVKALCERRATINGAIKRVVIGM